PKPAPRWAARFQAMAVYMARPVFLSTPENDETDIFSKSPVFRAFPPAPSEPLPIAAGRRTMEKAESPRQKHHSGPDRASDPGFKDRPAVARAALALPRVILPGGTPAKPGVDRDRRGRALPIP